MISFITLTCTDGQQLNKQYDHNDFQVDVPDSIGVSKIYLIMYVWFVGRTMFLQILKFSIFTFPQIVALRFRNLPVIYL